MKPRIKELPSEIEIGIDELIKDDDMSEAINEFLAKKYGFCTNSYCYGGSIVISNIDWDIEEQEEIQSKYGTLTIQRKGSNYEVLDTIGRILFFNCSYKKAHEIIDELLKYNSVGEWLETKQYEGVCWGSKQDIIDFAKDYAESNGRKFSKKILEDNYNKIGDTYVLFEYADCYKE